MGLSIEKDTNEKNLYRRKKDTYKEEDIDDIVQREIKRKTKFHAEVYLFQKVSKTSIY